MKNISIEFDFLEEGKWPSPIHSYITYHMIFDTNMDLTRKSRYVATWCHMPKSDKSRYEGVVSLESVCIAFTHADFNGIGIMAADIQNAYIKAP